MKKTPKQPKKCVWLETGILNIVDYWARNHTPLGEKVNISKSIERLVKSHPETR